MFQVIPGAVNVVAAAANGATASGGSSSGSGGVVSSGGLNPNASVFRCSKETARDSSTFDTPPPPTTTSMPQLQQQLSPDVTANVNTNTSSETPYVTGTMAYTPESGGAGVDTSSMRDNDDDVSDAAQQLWQPEAPVQQQQLTNGSVMTSSTDAGDGSAAAAVAESDGQY